MEYPEHWNCTHPHWIDHIDVKICSNCFKVEPIYDDEVIPAPGQGTLW